MATFTFVSMQDLPVGGAYQKNIACTIGIGLLNLYMLKLTLNFNDFAN